MKMSDHCTTSFFDGLLNICAASDTSKCKTILSYCKAVNWKGAAFELSFSEVYDMGSTADAYHCFCQRKLRVIKAFWSACAFFHHPLFCIPYNDLCIPCKYRIKRTQVKSRLVTMRRISGIPIPVPYLY
jgi:hypothetical protein